MESIKKSAARGIAIFLVSALLGILIIFQYRSLETYKLVGDLDKKTERELVDELLRVQTDKSRLVKRIEELEVTLNKYENSSNDSKIVEENLQKEIERLSTVACLTDVKGKGIIIRVDNNEDNFVNDTDISMLVNELKASDSEAIAVNDERISATSEIVNDGVAIRINGKKLKAPYTVKAIGDPHKLEYSLHMIGGKVEYLVNTSGLKVETQVSENLFLPKLNIGHG